MASWKITIFNRRYIFKFLVFPACHHQTCRWYLKWRNPKTYISCMDTASWIRKKPTPKIAVNKVLLPRLPPKKKQTTWTFPGFFSTTWTLRHADSTSPGSWTTSRGAWRLLLHCCWGGALWVIKSAPGTEELPSLKLTALKAPENGWLECCFPLGFRPIFRCVLVIVSGRVPPTP